MEPPDPWFADEFNVPQEDAVLVFDVRREVLVEGGLVAFPGACFEFADEVPKEAQHGSRAHLTKVFPDIFTAFQRLLLWGSARRCLLASSICCHVAMLRSSQLPHRVPRTNPGLRVGA